MNNLFFFGVGKSKIVALILSICLLSSCSEKTNMRSGPQFPGNRSTNETPYTNDSGLSGTEKFGVGIGAAIAAVLIGKVIYDAVNDDGLNDQALKDWDVKGPVVAAQFTLSNMSVQGYVKGGWPIAIDFQVNRPGPIFLKISAEGIDNYRIPMDGSTLIRKLQIFHFPKDFGASPKMAHVEIVAMDDSTGAEIPIPAKIYGIACGPNAVGSIGIDQINFGPGGIAVSQQQQANYSFFSHKSFNKVSAAFRKVEDRNGVIGIASTVKEEIIAMPAIDESKGLWIGPHQWDGKTKKNQPSPGFHVLQIRAWFGNGNDKTDWVVSLSPDWVEVKI